MDQTDPPMLLPDHAPHNNRNYSIVLAENTLPTKGNELTDLAREEIGTDASEASFNRNIRLPNMPKLIPSSVTASFGVTVYFLLLLPFVSLFLIPGFFIGGTIMADREIP